MPLNKQIHLVNRPSGEASVSNFQLVASDTPALQDGQVLVLHHFLSLDPYMRGRMNDAKSYAQPQALNQTMGGGTVGVVVESRNAKFAVGDKVVGMGGWQQYSVVDAEQPGALRKVDTTHIALSAYLGAVGMPGVTAWYGLVKIIAPKAGETMVVSAATGAVGSAFAALSKARGCRTVGIAGGPDKCKYAVDELGFDECIDYKLHSDAVSLGRRRGEHLHRRRQLAGTPAAADHAVLPRSRRQPHAVPRDGVHARPGQQQRAEQQPDGCHRTRHVGPGGRSHAGRISAPVCRQPACRIVVCCVFLRRGSLFDGDDGGRHWVVTGIKSGSSLRIWIAGCWKFTEWTLQAEVGVQTLCNTTRQVF